MGIGNTIIATLRASRPRAPEEGDDGSSGAYWCDDCGVRVRDGEVEREGLDVADDGTPLCPGCGEPLRFERAAGTGCAC